MAALIPATILTGFLGSGKTTLLKRILTEDHGQKIAVIENEFGEENIDGEIIASGGNEQIVQLSNGCICCSIREDLRATLELLALRRERAEIAFDRVLIETTGLADPGPIAQTFFLDQHISERYRPDAILTMVDAKHAMAQFDTRKEARRQVGFADQLLVSKTELISSDELERLRARLRQMNPTAPQTVAHFGHVGLTNLFDLRAFNLDACMAHQLDAAVDDAQADTCSADCAAAHGPDGHHHHHHQHHPHTHDDVTSFVFRSQRPFHPSRFGQFMNALVASCVFRRS